jgi:hypothetical protein
MSRPTHTFALAGLAALAAVSLSACGDVDGSAHSVAPAASTATTTTAPATPSATPSATPAPAPAPAAAAPVVPARAGTAPARNTGGTAGGGTGGGTNTGGSGTGGTNNGGGTAPSAPGPKIAKFAVSKPSCSVNSAPGFTSEGSVKLSWTVTGAGGAAIAVDNPDVYGAYGSDYPASGSLELPFGCGAGTTTHTYTVWPAGAKDVSKTISVSAHSDN